MTSSIDLVVSFDGRQDIYDVLQYTFDTWGDEQADMYERLLDDAFQHTRSFPRIGRVRDDGVREYAMRHHVILYRYEAETVIIVRVLHPRRLRR